MKTEAFKGTFGDFAEATDGADARGMDNTEIGDGKIIWVAVHQEGWKETGMACGFDDWCNKSEFWADVT